MADSYEINSGACGAYDVIGVGGTYGANPSGWLNVADLVEYLVGCGTNGVYDDEFQPGFAT